MSNRPDWAETTVPWDQRTAIWEYMAKGSTNSDVQRALEMYHDFYWSDKTIVKVRKELTQLPPELAQKLPSQVRIYWERLTGIELSDTETKETGSRVNSFDFSDQIKKHHNSLLAALDDFQGLSVFPPRGDELERWLSNIDEPRWPITQGYIYRDGGNKLTVKLFMDDQIEWEYLQQHLTGDLVWQAIDDWKSAMAEDVVARRELYEVIRQKVISETNLDISSELSLTQAGGNVLSSYYVHILYDQIFSKVIGIRLSSKMQEEFFIQDDLRISIPGYIIAAVNDVETAETVIKFLIDAQTRFTKLPIAKFAAVAYQQAEESTKRLKRDLKRILVGPGLHPDSRCDGCRAWFR